MTMNPNEFAIKTHEYLTERIEKKRDNLYQNTAETIRDLANDGYIDGEDGFTLDELHDAMTGHFRTGNFSKFGSKGEAMRVEAREKSDGGFLELQRGERHPHDAFSLRIVPQIERLVECGFLEAREDGRYVLGEEKWEELKFPEPEDQESE